MGPIQQLCQNLAAGQTHQSLCIQQPTPPDTAPPPYSSSEADDSSDEDDEDDTDGDDDTDTPFKLTFNAASHIQGNSNLIPTSPSSLADATRFSTLLLAAVNQINNRLASGATTAASGGKSARRRGLKLDLTINCGVTIIGDRNVVGNFGLRPKAPAQAVAGPSAPMSPVSAGAKRKAEDEGIDRRPLAKRTASGGGPGY